jgi:hypothetical protein
MITKRHTYKGYIIDRDNLGRLYIYNTKSPYSEDSDKKYIADHVDGRSYKLRPIKLSEVKAKIDEREAKA